MVKIPQNIALIELKKEITRLINYTLTDLEVPAYAIEPIVGNIHTELCLQAEKEYAQSVQTYNEALKQEQEESATDAATKNKEQE